MIGLVKIGGAEGNSFASLAQELARRTQMGERWIVVHGASGVMNALCRERGVEIRTVMSPSGYSSRFVGEVERSLFQEAAMTFGGQLSEALVAQGVTASQLGPDGGRSVMAKRKDCLRESINGRVRMLRGNYSGSVTHVEPRPILSLLDAGVIPVIPPLGWDPETELSLNIDGDRLAASIASAIGANPMLILSNVPGLLRDRNNPDSLLKEGALDLWERIEPFAEGNMKRKLVACKEALEGGVSLVYLSDGRVLNPIGHALEGGGTCLRARCTEEEE